MFSAFGIQQYITGAVLSVLLGLIVIGGIKRIAQVTEKLVPFMAVVYLLGAFSILAYNYQYILPSFISVFSNIFPVTAATGGFLGATVVWAFNRGVNRGLFSNGGGARFRSDRVMRQPRRKSRYPRVWSLYWSRSSIRS